MAKRKEDFTVTGRDIGFALGGVVALLAVKYKVLGLEKWNELFHPDLAGNKELDNSLDFDFPQSLEDIIAAGLQRK